METQQNPRAVMLVSTVHVAKSLKSAWENLKEWVQKSAGGHSNWTKGGTEEHGGEAASGCVALLWGNGGGRSGSLFQMRRQRSEDDKGTYQETNLCSSIALTERLMELHWCLRLFRLFLLFFQDFGLRSATKGELKVPFLLCMFSRGSRRHLQTTWITSSRSPQHEGDSRKKASGPNAPNWHVCHEGITRADMCSHMPENSRISTLSSSQVRAGFYFCLADIEITTGFKKCIL